MKYHVYAIREAQSRGIQKIGSSNNPQKRVRQLQTGNFRPLELTGILASFATQAEARQFEALLHLHLKDRRLSGEWFAVTIAELTVARDIALLEMANPKPKSVWDTIKEN